MPFPSIAQDIPLEQAGALGGPTPAAAAPLSFFDRVKLGNREASAGPDWGFNQMDWRESALDEIRSGLRKRGVTPVDVMATADGRPGELPPQTVERHWRELFGQVEKARGSDPKFLSDYGAVFDRSGFEQLIRDRRRASLEEVGSQAPDGLGFGGFVGQLGHGFKDPLSYLPIGGPEASAVRGVGARILRQALTGAAINAGVTIGVEPLVRRDARQLGVERTAGDFFTDLMASSTLGGAVGGVHEGVPALARATGDTLFPGAMRRHDANAFGKALNDAVGAAHVPPASPFHSFDAKVARSFANLVPEAERTPDEKAALSAIERDAEVKATSPFVASPAGDDHHAQSLDTALHVLSNPAEVAARGPVKPIARERIAAPEDVAGTRMPARELLKAKIGGVEGTARNPASGAEFQYQFVPRTWVSLFKRRYPADPRSFDQIAALRSDPHLRDVLINDLISENAAALRHAGFAENAGNLYLAHVLGHDRAVTVLRAGPEAKLGELLPHDYFKGNPFKPTDTSASLVHWAYGKMGEKGLPEHIAAVPEAAAGGEAIATAEAAPGVEPATTGRFDVEALYGDAGMTDRPILRPELFGSPEEHAAAQLRFERSRDASEGFAPVMSRAEAFSPYEHFDALRNYRGTVTAEALGERLGLTPEEAVKAVRTMQSVDRNSPFILARERGAEAGAEPTRIMRRPPKPAQSLIQFLAARGGVHDAGGDLRAMDADVGRRFRKPLINNDSGMGLDDALQAAFDADYFPELHGVDKPDVQVLLDAIDAELRGDKRLGASEQLDAAEAARRALHEEEPPPEPQAPDRELAAPRVPAVNYDAIVAAARELDALPTITDDMLIDASDRIDAGEHPEAALVQAIVAQTYRDMEEMGYGFGDEGQRFTDDGGLAEPRGSDGVDPADDVGGGRSQSVEEAAAGGRAQLAQLAHDPAAGHFSDPVGPAAEAQADSLVHDLEMAAHGGTIREVLDRKQHLALRQRWLGEQERALGRDAAMDRLRKAELADEEPWLDPDYLLKTYENDPEGGAAVLEAIAEHEALSKVGYRLGEDGGESDLGAILAEINEAQKAATEMRNCLKPKGGEE